MSVKLTTSQASWLRSIRGGKNTSPPIPQSVVRSLTGKGLISETRDRNNMVRYVITEAGWAYLK